MIPPKRLPADDKPQPPLDAQLYRVAWDSYGRKTTRAPRLHLAWRVGRIWHTLCGHATMHAEPVAAAAPICAVCQARYVRILWALHLAHVITILQNICAKYDADHSQDAPEGVL